MINDYQLIIRDYQAKIILNLTRGIDLDCDFGKLICSLSIKNTTELIVTIRLSAQQRPTLLSTAATA